MVDLQIYASILLIFRAISVVFIVMVIKRQWQLFKLPIDKSIRTFRLVLFCLSILVLIGNIIPIAVDVLALLGETNRPDHIPSASVLYTFNNSIAAVCSAILIWLLYFIAGKDNDES